MVFRLAKILTFSTWIVQHFLIFSALDNCAFGNKLPGSDLLLPRSVLSLGLQGVEIRLNSASNMSNKSLTWWLSYTIQTIRIFTWHMFALVSSCFPLVTSQFFFFVFPAFPSRPSQHLGSKMAQALGARHKPPDSAETEMPWDAHRMQTSKVTMRAMRALTRRVSESTWPKVATSVSNLSFCIWHHFRRVSHHEALRRCFDLCSILKILTSET